MALEAESWCPHYKQFWIDGIMDFMAIQTVFNNRWVFKKKWTPFIGMTPEAYLIWRTAAEKFFAVASMWIVAVTAFDLGTLRNMRE